MEMVFRRSLRDTHRQQCFNDYLNPQFVSCSWERQELIMRYDIQPWMLNPMKIVHGGIITACCDLTMGLPARYLKRDTGCLTVQIQTQFLRAIPQNGSFTVKAAAIKTGRTLYFLTASAVRSSDNLPAASTNAEFI